MSVVDFKLNSKKPFVIEGEKGKYTIPPFEILSVDDFEEISRINPDMNVRDRIPIFKKFILKFAPEIESENIGDMGYSQIFAAYEKQQQLGE